MDNFDLHSYLRNNPLLENKDGKEFWAVERPNGETVKYFGSEKEAQAWVGKNDPQGMKDYNIRQIEEAKSTKMTKSELKAKIKEMVLAEVEGELSEEVDSISAKKLFALIARDLQFAGPVQDDEMLSKEEAIEIMRHVIALEGSDISPEAALGEYIASGDLNENIQSTDPKAKEIEDKINKDPEFLKKVKDAMTAAEKGNTTDLAMLMGGFGKMSESEEGIEEMARIATNYKLADNYEEMISKMPENKQKSSRYSRVINYLKDNEVGTLKSIADEEFRTSETAAVSPIMSDLVSYGVVEKAGLVTPKQEKPTGDGSRGRKMTDVGRVKSAMEKFKAGSFDYTDEEKVALKAFVDSIAATLK